MIGIDVITGFLGSGKTTFIKSLLDSKEFGKENLVIIENEFGEINIDSDAFKGSGTKVYEINKGCICCSLKEDFLTTLIELSSNENIERIIIEPSGIFVIDVLKSILKDPRISSKYEIESVITIVDVKNFHLIRSPYNMFFQSQLRNADSILLSKASDASERELKAITDEIRTYNDSARIMLKNWNALTKKDYDVIFSNTEESQSGDSETHDLHHQEIESLGIYPKSIGGYTELKKFLEGVRNGEYGEIIRLKGHIGSYEIQYVNRSYTLESSEVTDNKLSIIGNRIDKDKLQLV